jgi:hypothetical protein
MTPLVEELDALERMLSGRPLADVLRFAQALTEIEAQREDLEREEMGTASTVPPKGECDVR